MFHHLSSVSFYNTVNHQDSIMLTLHYTLTCNPQTILCDLHKFTFHFQTGVKYFCSIYLKDAQFTNHIKDSDWETLTQHKTITCRCALFKAYSGEWAWKAKRNRLWRTYFLSRVDHVRKIRDRKERTNIGKYSFVNRTKNNWNQLHAEALGTFPCKPTIFRKRVRKAVINKMKW